MSYNPIPTRVWSRVQGQCTYVVPGSTYEQSYNPLTGQTVTQAQADYEMKQIYKGNVLQYKGNSARFTKLQKYSQLAKLAGPNRTKVFATQSQTYTNPNTTGLLRVGYNTYPFPNQIVGAPNNISGPFAYGMPNPNDCSGNSIQEGGTLVCGTYANPCSGEIYKQSNTSSIICNPASASNVPGPTILCWDNKVQSWFPRQRYIMNNGANKWPVNYKGFVSAYNNTSQIYLFEGPKILKSITNFTTGTATIQIFWSPPSIYCGTIYGYQIYIDDIFVDNVISPLTTYTTAPLSINQDYKFNIKVMININAFSSTYQIVTNLSSPLIVNLPPIYTTTGSPTSSFSSGSIMLKYNLNGVYKFNTYYDLLMQYTLVGGGSGGGYWFFTVGTAAGGGGQVLNTNSPRIVTKNNFTLVVGAGGLGATTPSNGQIGTDSSISAVGFNVSTNNNLYAGQGGRGFVNFSYNGGGGIGGNITSANGGVYNTGPANGTGGGGGSLTIVNVSNVITSVTIGGQGQGTQASAGGSGGSGHQGIDLITYGGGGGGGANSVSGTGGAGGSGGGGTGAFNIPSPTPSQNGQAPGGGGGGGCNNGVPGLIPGNGADGIIIIQFTNPS